MVNYYMCTLPTGSCIGCNASLYRGDAGQRRSRKRSKKSLTIRKDVSHRIFNNYHIILRHHHSLCGDCISSDISTWIMNVKDSSFEINRSTSTLLSKQLKPKKKTTSPIKFDDTKEGQCKLFTRLSKAQISEIASTINTANQNVFIFFTIMFRGISQVFASVLFGITQPRISQILHETIEKMSYLFVPKHIGSHVFNRKDIIRHHSPEWVKLLLPNAVAMIDSTYVYIQKSWNFNNQKKSYCQHKANNLVKMMAIMLLDGKWFDVYGPYYSDGHNNDELIWNTLSDDSLEEVESEDLSDQRQQLHATFSKNDIFIGDRGFTRSKGKWNLYVPDSIYKGESQLSTTKANQTRCITRIRNAIERGFGRLKQWKFIDNVVNTEYVPIIGLVMRILCAVDNAYFSDLVEDNGDAYANAEIIINNLQLENEIMSLEADAIGWKKANTIDISNIVSSYDYNDIKQFSSEYSIRIAHAYLGHAQQQWTTYVHHDFPSTIKVKNIVSRYKTTDNPKKHTLWIRFGENKLDDVASYCTCRSGSRTAGGSCSHVAAALIALKYWKNNQKIPSFYTKATALFLNVLDCTSYKQRKKNEQVSREDDKTNNYLSKLTLLDEKSTNDDESTDDEASDNEAPVNETTDDEAPDNEATDNEAPHNETTDDETTDDELTDGDD